MKQLLKSEFYKLGTQKSFWGLAIFSFLLSSILMLDGSVPSDSSAFFDHALYILPLLYVLIMIFGALFIGKDFDLRTIQIYISAGHKRGSILAAKSIVHLTGCAAILFAPLLFHTATGFILYGISDNGIIPILTKLVLAFIIICMMGLLPFLCAFLFKDIGKTLTVPLMLYFIMLFLLNGRHYRLMAVCFPMGQLRLLSLGQLSNLYVSAFLADCIWLIVCYTWAYRDFSRADLN
ncbi:ABC transporter permease [Anaerostipes sp.]|uniref:ABC transporter permease n=1 Tax=Anaerostipes sp. TaxID=1872530 RepID=UPI0025B8F7EA|nr:ABC transporter permease [Anaerostipes sp.]MBS7008398.1 ABC transporter permease [Anaerostipes sp.]